MNTKIIATFTALAILSAIIGHSTDYVYGDTSSSKTGIAKTVVKSSVTTTKKALSQTPINGDNAAAQNAKASLNSDMEKDKAAAMTAMKQTATSFKPPVGKR